MSTSSKIQENQTNQAPCSSRKSFLATSSQHITERSGSLDQDSSLSIQREEVLQLQIKQLKRENQFLKKKINQLNDRLKGNKPERKKSTKKGIQKDERQQVHISIEFFYQQISTLLKSISQLFRVQLSSCEKNILESGFSYQDQLNPVKKYIVVNKFMLNRQLQKIILQKEQQKYPQMLEVFTKFYKAKQQSDSYIRNYVDQLNEKALELNKSIVEKAQKKNLRRSDARSQHTYEKSITQKTIGSYTPYSSSFNVIQKNKLSENKLLSDLNETDRERIFRGLDRIL